MKKGIAAARLRTLVFDVAPDTARHTVSTQLVVEGVHPHKKDQILGHAADDMSRHYTYVPQAPLIEAINKLPTIFKEWLDADWMREPVKLVGRRAKTLKKAQRESGKGVRRVAGPPRSGLASKRQRAPRFPEVPFSRQNSRNITATIQAKGKEHPKPRR